MFWGQSSSFYKDGTAKRKRDASPFFIIFMDCVFRVGGPFSIFWVIWPILSGPDKGVITKEVFSLEESLKSLESQEDGRTLLCFPQFGGSLESLNSLNL